MKLMISVTGRGTKKEVMLPKRQGRVSPREVIVASPYSAMAVPTQTETPAANPAIGARVAAIRC